MLRNIAESIGVNTAILQTDEQIIDNASKILASSAKFSELLRSRNVEVPTKISPTTGKEAPALAKTDEAFIALQEHPDPVVSTAAQARLGVKSTLLETRIQAFLDAADATQGRLPVPLKYYGADTTGRWSGTQYNCQNLPRVGKKPKPSDALRNSIRAPKGHMVVVADLSGIELRVNHFLWKVPSSMHLFRQDPEKADLYKDFASRLYGKSVEDVTKDERQVGKVAHLGLGFGAGPATFKNVAKIMAGIDLSDAAAEEVVAKWRADYVEIAQGWRTCHGNLQVIASGKDGYPIDPWGMCVPCAEGIRTPKGLIRYPNLRKERTDEGKDEWVYGDGRHKARIYAGKVTENIVQHLARCVIADNALEVRKQTGASPALMVHDELVYVVPEADAERMLAYVQSVMRTPPVWWPELVTWSEGDIAETYGAAK
jgi:DNA polymerase